MKKEKYKSLETDLENALKAHAEAKNWKEEVEAWKEVKKAYRPLKDELIAHRKNIRDKIK